MPVRRTRAASSTSGSPRHIGFSAPHSRPSRRAPFAATAHQRYSLLDTVTAPLSSTRHRISRKQQQRRQCVIQR